MAGLVQPTPAGEVLTVPEASTGVSSPSTFAEAFAAAPASCPGCERARSVAVGLQGEVERLTATLARVEALAEEWHWKDPVWLGLGPTGRCDSGQPLLDLLALDKRRGGE